MRSSEPITRRAALKTVTMLAAASAFPAIVPAIAQTAWPSKPIRLLVPFAPGGSSEIVARSAANEIGKSLGQMCAKHRRSHAHFGSHWHLCGQSVYF